MMLSICSIGASTEEAAGGLLTDTPSLLLELIVLQIENIA